MISRALIFLCAVSFIGSLRAGLVTQVLEFRLFDAAPAAALVFNPVNPSLGKINAVTATVDVTRRLDVGVWKTGGADGPVTFTTSVTGSSFLVEGQAAAFDAANLTISQNLPTVSYSAASVWINAFKNDYLSNQEPSVISGMKGSKDTFLSTSFSLPLSFDGTLDMSYDAGFWNPENTNNWTPLGTWKLDMIGKVTLTYEYNSIPEPAASAAMLGAGALLLASALRRVRRRASQRATNSGR